MSKPTGKIRFERKGPLKGVMITFADLEACTRTSSKKATSWVRAAGGSVAEHVNIRATHLVCSRRYYERKGEEVVLAQLFPKVKVVSWDWLERSLFNKFCLHVEPFLLGRHIATAKKQKMEKALERKHEVERQERQVIDARAKIMAENSEFLNIPGYDIAFDPVGQKCDITLFQIDKANNTSMRIMLRMCETVVLPRYYGAYVVHGGYEQKDHPEILRWAPSQFYQVFPVFCAFFERKTGYAWFRRPLQNLQPAPGFWGFKL